MTCLGNISLLEQPKTAFLCSRCTQSNAILPCLDWATTHRNDTVPIISTFHSKLEDAILDILIKGNCPIIIVLARSLYKEIPHKLKPLLKDNRLLIISLSDQTRISRKSAYLANKFICDNSTTLTFGFIAPESPLQNLYQNAIQNNIETKILCQFNS